MNNTELRWLNCALRSQKVMDTPCKKFSNESWRASRLVWLSCCVQVNRNQTLDRRTPAKCIETIWQGREEQKPTPAISEVRWLIRNHLHQKSTYSMSINETNDHTHKLPCAETNIIYF